MDVRADAAGQLVTLNDLGLTAWNRDAGAYTPLRFPSQYADQETGLHYNLNRHYDPETARYVSADPYGLVPAPNPAAYVVNPLTWMDPEGIIAKGCTQNGGWYGGLLPANLNGWQLPRPRKGLGGPGAARRRQDQAKHRGNGASPASPGH